MDDLSKLFSKMDVIGAHQPYTVRVHQPVAKGGGKRSHQGGGGPKKVGFLLDSSKKKPAARIVWAEPGGSRYYNDKNQQHYERPGSQYPWPPNTKYTPFTPKQKKKRTSSESRHY